MGISLSRNEWSPPSMWWLRASDPCTRLLWRTPLPVPQGSPCPATALHHPGASCVSSLCKVEPCECHCSTLWTGCHQTEAQGGTVASESQDRPSDPSSPGASDLHTGSPPATSWRLSNMPVAPGMWTDLGHKASSIFYMSIKEQQEHSWQLPRI